MWGEGNVQGCCWWYGNSSITFNNLKLDKYSSAITDEGVLLFIKVKIKIQSLIKNEKVAVIFSCCRKLAILSIITNYIHYIDNS